MDIKPIVDEAINEKERMQYKSIAVQASTSSNILSMKSSGQVIILPPPPCDEYIIEDCKARVLGEVEKLYNVLVDQVLCEVVNENVAKQSSETTPSSLPTLRRKIY